MTTTPATDAPARPGLYLAAGDVVAGRYVVTREIGRGGHSVVYAARDRDLGADVALKLLVPPPAVARLARERLRREVQAVRGLAHEHVAAVHDLVEDGERSVLVMELVDGPDLERRVRERGPLAPDGAAALGREVADALSAAHRRGILHRDAPFTLSRDVEPLLLETLDRLPREGAPGGAARTLLTDVARVASVLHGSSALRPLGDTLARARGRLRAGAPAAAPDGGVGELVAAACDGALALARVDGVLALLERLLETVAALGAACADVARAAGADTTARLQELSRELERDAALKRAAAEEVEALLAGTRSTASH